MLLGRDMRISCALSKDDTHLDLDLVVASPLYSQYCCMLFRLSSFGYSFIKVDVVV